MTREEIKQWFLKNRSELYNTVDLLELFYKEIATPEPLDPYTCELCMGDVVMVDEMEKCVIVDIENVGWWVCIQKSGHAFLARKRSALKLIHRNGATIKEVGNG